MRGLLLGGRRAGIHDVQQQLGFDHFFERGAERPDQRGRQIADETDGSLTST